MLNPPYGSEDHDMILTSLQVATQFDWTLVEKHGVTVAVTI